MRAMPTKLRAAFDWMERLGELEQAVKLRGDDLTAYAAASAELATAFGENDVTAEDIAAHVEWERDWRNNG